MNKIPKINNDAESRRLQRNMTDTQKRNSNNVKEGKIVNSFVKDPLVSLDETFDHLVISHNEVDLPQKVFEKEQPKNKGLYYIAAASTGVMGFLGGFTYMAKRFSEKKLDSTKEYLLPGITRNHCINDELHQSIFSMIQSPNRKTVLACFGVITMAAMAFIAKNFVDGFKDIWIKKQEADIQKNLQERLIEVETQSFSGKIQIIRSMLASKAKIFSETLAETPKKIAFASKNKENAQNTKKQNKLMWVVGGATLAGIITLGYLSMRNLRKTEEFMKKGLENTKIGLENVINEFNSGKQLGRVEGLNGEILTGKDGYKFIIENLLESIYATPAQIEEYISKMKLPDNEKTEFIKHVKKSMNQATEKVNSAMGGSGRNKITYFSHVNEYLSFFYDWLMNPQNPQFKNLFFGITGISALSYIGTSATSAVKDVQVKKYNADIELDLQKRLVSTELRNFKAKKDSAIEPLCEEFFAQKAAGKKPEELKVLADNILFEVKNGPPFVYS